MAVPNFRLICCDSCGKLLKTEQFGDALSPMEWKKCKMIKENTLLEIVRCKTNKYAF